MKKYLQISLVIVLGLAIAHQVYVYVQHDKDERPSIPDVPLILLDQTQISLSELGEDKNAVVFLVSSTCGFCKQEIQQVRRNLNNFSNTQVIFLSFESLPVIEKFKSRLLPEEREFLTFAQVSKVDVKPFLEKELAYPYLLWYDEEGVQKAQFRGLFPVERILEVIDKQS